MPIIDADCHVIESDRTWDYFDPAEAQHKPRKLAARRPGKNELMAIEGRPHSVLFSNPTGDDREKVSGFARTSEASRTLTDIDDRLRHMDELGVDIQVLYPTLFLTQITANPAVEAACTRSYNRWLGDVCTSSRGRLRWVAVPPLLAMEEALAQIGQAAEQGACGVLMRGFEGQRILSDPYFFPVYDEAQRLNLPICIHAGGANPAFDQLVRESFSAAKLPVISAFHTLVKNRIPEQFPRLRFGFIEAAASWLPFVLTDLRRRLDRDGRPLGREPLADNRLFVTCQTNDDLAYLIGQVGDANLVIGTDYGHADTASELEALRNLHQTTGVAPASLANILEHNPAKLYGL